MKQMIKKMFKSKVRAGMFIFILIGVGFLGYQRFSPSTVATRYVLANMQKGTLITSISGSGQISALDQVDIKPKVSGNVIAVAVKNGQEIKAGNLIVSLDARDANRAVRDIQSALANARLSLAKLKNPPTVYALTQAQNAVDTAQNNLTKLILSQPIDYQKAQEANSKAQNDISTAYEDSFNEISNTFLDLPTIITQLSDILYSNGISASEPSVGKDQWNTSVLFNTTAVADQDKLQAFKTSAESDYKIARQKYDASFDHYKTITRYSDKATIEALLDETLETTRSIAQAAKNESNYLDAWADERFQRNLPVFSLVKTYQTNLTTDIGKTNGHLSSSLSFQSTLKDDKQTIKNTTEALKEMDQNNPLDLAFAKALVKEKGEALRSLQAGADTLDIQSQELSVRQQENALLDAQEKLSDYTIRAPFDGIVATVSVKKEAPVSTGTAIATLVTHQRLAQISLNEIDAAKVKQDQKATLTFDAVDGLSITGQVAEIDTIGTVTQGVVTYNVKILFDTQDERIKPGMSVSAAIITKVKQDAFIVPNSAVKSRGNNHYVEIFDTALPQSQGNQGVTSSALPRQQKVGVGLSNDTSTEIISGLKEGDQIVVRTIAPSTTTNPTAQAPSLFGVPGGGRALRGGGG